MPVSHNHVSTPTEKVGCPEWNDNHKVVNLTGYELIETKTLNAGSGTVEWTGLSGNVDDEYFLDVIDVVGSGTGERVMVYFNEDLTVDNYYHLNMLYNSNATGRDASSTGFSVAEGVEGTPGISNSSWRIRAKSGKYRVITGDFFSYSPSIGKAHAWVSNYVWKNSVEEITKIRAVYSNVVSGTIRLWRRIPIE